MYEPSKSDLRVYLRSALRIYAHMTPHSFNATYLTTSN